LDKKLSASAVKAYGRYRRACGVGSLARGDAASFAEETKVLYTNSKENGTSTISFLYAARSGNTSSGIVCESKRPPANRKRANVSSAGGVLGWSRRSR
jgi:hypothetical protein